MAPPTLSRHLVALGYGTRREVNDLLRRQCVTTAAGAVLRDGDPFTHDDVRVHGTPLDPPPGAVVLLHKPVGHVCSLRDRPPLVYDLLPPTFTRRTPVMATVGRLDADTSGLLLLTDDGQLLHRLTSPKWHVPKCYAMTLADPLRGDEAARLSAGTLLLKGETTPLLPATFEPTGEREADVVIHEGRYHQVRRMMAAIGHHVLTLHRVAFGPLTLGDLPAGRWRVLDATEVQGLHAAATASRRAP